VVTSGAGIGGSGRVHACAVTSAGTLNCWGANSHGQLGNGTTTDAFSPVTVFTSGVLDVEVSFEEHTCAILSGGALKCWGRNDYGQLGNNSIVDSHIPVDVSGLSAGVTAMSGSTSHTSAIVNGGMKCWGSNIRAELGQGSTGTPQLIPADVPGMLSGITSISATGNYGQNKTCAVVNGGAKCWGQGYGGTLGDGTQTDRFSPTTVTGLSSGVTKIQINDYSACALMDTGALKCWGGNGNAEAGLGTIGATTSPSLVLGIQAGVLDFDLGHGLTCTRVIGNAVKCWGNNANGAMGIGYYNYSFTPIDVMFP